MPQWNSKPQLCAMTMPRCMDMRLRRTFQTPLPTLRVEERMKLSRCLRTSYRPQPSLSDLYVTKPQFPKPEPAVPVHFAFGRQSQESKSQAYRPSCTLSAGCEAPDGHGCTGEILPKHRNCSRQRLSSAHTHMLHGLTDTMRPIQQHVHQDHLLILRSQGLH